MMWNFSSLQKRRKMIRQMPNGGGSKQKAVLNDDGFFENEVESREFYQTNSPFNILGRSLQVEMISPAGDKIVLVSANVEVPPRPQVIEIENETKLTEIYHRGGWPSYVWIGPDGVVLNPELKGDLDDLYDAF